MPTSSAQVLIVEDDSYKAKALTDFLQAEWPGATIVVVNSLNGAIKSVCEGTYQLALIDMSLPTYELGSDRHGGGDPQGFAGEDILRFMESECPETRTVVVTQLSEFSDGSLTRTLEQLTESLKDEFGASYLGLVSYSGRHGGWRDTLRKLLQDAGIS